MTKEQLEILLARCVGTLEGIYLSGVLPIEAKNKVAKLLAQASKCFPSANCGADQCR
jgi:hypothetical protein